MKQKQIQVYRYAYDMSESTWTVHIAAYSAEEAIAFLNKKVVGIRITSSSHIGSVDVFSDSVIKDILIANKPKKKPVGRPPKNKD